MTPLAKLAVFLRMDALLPFASYRAMAVPVLGSSAVEAVLQDAARHVDRALPPDNQPQAGVDYRAADTVLAGRFAQ